ncbi:hypothetical protein V8O11_11900 [Erwinia aphidicola]|uniref:hypothetical protein n=1 Tax=Erwinia TaxID=551 RepID=UPI0010608BF0|nr:hypothetical protein [Erwinia aphidicola]MCP2231682.1 hypothetical protein [Erwinia aphidicola]
MKLTHLALLATTLLVAHATVAADSVTLRVTGTIVPVACSPMVSGQPQQPDLKIDCFRPRAVDIRWTESGGNRPIATPHLSLSPRTTLKRSIASGGASELEIYYL